MSDSEQPPAQDRPNTWVWGFLAVAWTCILLMGYSLGLHERFLNRDEPQAGNPQDIASRQAPVNESLADGNTSLQHVCDPSPPSKGGLLVQPTGRASSAVQRAFVDIDNQHFFPVLLKFTSVSAGGAGKVVYVDRHTRDRMDIPAGNYRLMVEVGEKWCSIAEGFNNGHTLSYQENVTINDGAMSVLRFVSIGVEPKDMLVSFSSGGIETRSVNGKMLELSRQIDGHFHVRAEVNRYPITFMVDTGATKTSIPFQAAKDLGLDRKCKPEKFNTAGGTVSGCTAIADELRIGDFVLRRIEVSFSSVNNMPLLGMNVLSQFRLQQMGNVMLISN
jgi:clan AA aspartic protease (TIGR02281 family)